MNIMDQEQVLLFDLGGVLVRFAPVEEGTPLLPGYDNGPAFKRLWTTSNAVRVYELGRLSEEQFAEAFVAEHQLPVTPDEFLKAFLSWDVDFYWGAKSVLKKLRKNHWVGCLSNSNGVHWARFNGFKKEFDVAMSSHITGYSKPDEEAFLLAALACGAEPESIHYFDDMPKNVEIANSLGMKAHHTIGYKSLLETLQTEGFLS
jgi:putative hydrolase of the HAD superfamily